MFFVLGLICEIITANSQVVYVLMQNREVIVFEENCKIFPLECTYSRTYMDTYIRIHIYVYTYVYVHVYI